MKYLLIIFVILAGCMAVNAQTDCPPEKVCISREAALTAVQNAAKVVALEKEGEAKDLAIQTFKDEINALRVKVAEQSGELSGIKQNAVSDRAIIDLLLKSVRPKRIALINIF